LDGKLRRDGSRHESGRGAPLLRRQGAGAGKRRIADAPDRWEDIASKVSTTLRSRCRVETAHVSPDKRHLAICSEVRTLFGLRVQQAGLLYSIEDGSIMGRVAVGKRTAKGWIEADN
jgi:hypothetical protein